MAYEIIPIHLGSIIPYIPKTTRVFFIAQMTSNWRIKVGHALNHLVDAQFGEKTTLDFS